jgi:putative inorganic carbon (hco3(-)) transporter
LELLKNNKALFSISILYILLNGLLLYFEIYYALVIPFLLLIVWYAFFNLELLFLITVFFTPISILISDFYGTDTPPVNLSVPTEPILAAILLIFIMKSLTGQLPDKKIFKHPVSIAILINLLWIFITCIPSSMPGVSFKFLLARIWFVVPMYFIALLYFNNTKFIKKYLWLYIIPFIFVVFYTLYNTMAIGLFIKNAAHGSMRPFYNDHTSYGAILAMFVPILFCFLLLKSYSPRLKLLIFSVLLLFLAAIIFSYTRAAWISILAAMLVFIVLILKINWKWLIVGSVTIVSLFFVFQFEITDELSKNKQDSSEDLGEHVSSITNIATDASNLERINRWNSAFKMFNERPIFGFGPGTYMFQYAPYQMSFDRTIISTDFGEGGNAHSEYIGPLAESGILGSVTFLGIIIMTIITGVKVYYKSKNRELRILALSALLGLITYYIHGFMNNFLDTDKASIPFWGFTAIIVAVDLAYKNQKEQSQIYEDLEK